MKYWLINQNRSSNKKALILESGTEWSLYCDTNALICRGQIFIANMETIKLMPESGQINNDAGLVMNIRKILLNERGKK